MGRRQLLILFLGFSLLIAITFMGTSIESIVAFLHPTNAIQQAQVGDYQVTLQISPNPPTTTRPANLMLHMHSVTQQLLPNAHITVESNMETMNMGIERINAIQQNTGTYIAQLQFAMSGLWQVKVVIVIPGKKTESAVFTVAVQ